VHVREAIVADADAMGEVLEELVAAGQRTSRADPDFVRSHYLNHPHRLHCFVGLDERGTILGFQSLKRADESNPYGTPIGWGIIGTHVRPSAARRGVGAALFAATVVSAREADLPAIEAYIGEANAAALQYYEALGFGTYRTRAGIICKSFQISSRSAA